MTGIVSSVYPTQTTLEKNIYERTQTLVNIFLILPQVQFAKDDNFVERDKKFNWAFVQYNMPNSIVI